MTVGMALCGEVPKWIGGYSLIRISNAPIIMSLNVVRRSSDVVSSPVITWSLTVIMLKTSILSTRVKERIYLDFLKDCH